MKNKIIPRENFQGPVGTSPFVYAGYICNNNCLFCFEKDLKFFDKGIRVLKKEIKAIRDKFDVINFMGREPTLRKDLAKLIAYARKLKFKQISLTTNGRKLAYPTFVDQLIKGGLNQFVITVVGHQAKLHDSHTLAKGSFKQTFQGIKNVLAQSQPGLSLVVNIMVTKKNYKDLLPMVDFYVKLGVREINIGHILPFNQEIINSRAVVAKMSAVVPYLIKIQDKYGGRVKFLFVEYPACVFPKKYRHLSFPCLEESPQKARLSLCRQCAYRRQCVGIHQYYLDLYDVKEFKI